MVMNIDKGRYDDFVAPVTEEEALQTVHQISKYVGNEAKYVKDFLRNKKTPFTAFLERALADKLKAKYAIALNSGTSALHVALMTCGVGSGDEVVVPALYPQISMSRLRLRSGNHSAIKRLIQLSGRLQLPQFRHSIPDTIDAY